VAFLGKRPVAKMLSRFLESVPWYRIIFFFFFGA